MKWILSFILLTFSGAVWAEDESLNLPSEEELSVPPAPTPIVTEKKEAVKRSNQPTNVLDFEGEVIEGERRRPDLFLQMSIDNVKFDSLIYNREDFNDYLEVDRRGRTRYLKLK